MKFFIWIAILTVNTFYANAKDGGISGGGGDLIPSKQIGSKALGEMIGASRMQLLLYFNYLDQEGEGRSRTYAGLFGENGLVTQVSKQKVNEANRAPCLDKNGKPVDGSSYFRKKQGVCISTFNLGKKLSKENGRIQLLGLMAHEYAHLAGAVENQAQNVQRDVIKNLLNSSSAEAEGFLSRYVLKIFEAQLDLSKLEKLLNQEDTSSLCQQTRDLGYRVQDLKSTTENNFSIVNRKDDIFINTMTWIVENILAGTCTLFTSPVDELSGYKRYPEAFAENSKINLTKLNLFINPQFGYGEFDGAVEVPYITDKNIITSELQRLSRSLHQLENLSYAKLHWVSLND